MKTFVIGDIHGGYRAMLQCFERSGFDKDKDKLICLGDVSDGWSEVPECFNELLKIKNMVYIIANHDVWLLDWFQTGKRPTIWTSQGGQATIDAYKDRFNGYVESHKILLENALNYFVSDDNKLFVHGGFDWHYPIEEQDRDYLVWDRDLYAAAAYWESLGGKMGEPPRVKQYNEVFIGHTSTSYYYKDLKPVHLSNVWNLDQGGGWEGKLTMMDVDSHEYYQ